MSLLSRLQIKPRFCRWICNDQSGVKYFLSELVSKKRSSTRGFTIIELLVVLAVISGITVIFVASYPAALERGRDAERRKSLGQYAAALEIYSARNGGLYPVNTTSIELTSLCATLGVSDCPDDPQAPSQRYMYQSNTIGTDYIIWAQLERETQDWGKCSSGSSGYLAGTPTNGSCNLVNM